METYERNVPICNKGIALLIVDPQVDFHPGGSLGIPSANEDAKRTAEFIQNTEIAEIYVTLDSHQKYHIAHPLFWKNAKGERPTPFTVISLKQVQDKEWEPSRPDALDWSLKYLTELENNGRFTLTIWPEHCLISTPGHCVVPEVAKALADWEEKNETSVTYVMKGCNSYTEHYSAIKAEVVRDDDPRTGLNTSLLEKLRKHEKVVICGQAKSHCVNFTVRDLADHWDQGKLNSLVVLEDCCSSVVGFEEAGQKFISDMKEKGLTVGPCKSVISS